MKSKAISLVLVLLVFTAPLVLAVGTNTNVLKAKECKNSGGTWILDDCEIVCIDDSCNECEYYAGYCKYPTQDQPLINTGSSSHNQDNFCNIKANEQCQININKWKINKEKVNLKIEGKDYYIEYMGWSFPYWLLKQKVAVIRVTDNKNNRIFWGTIKAGSFEFIRKSDEKYKNFEVIVEDMTLNKAYIKIKA